MSAEPHICIRFVRYLDDSYSFHVIARGSREGCEEIADAGPPDMEINRREIVAECFMVKPEAEYREIMKRAGHLFAGEPKGVAGEQAARAEPEARLQ